MGAWALCRREPSVSAGQDRDSVAMLLNKMDGGLFDEIIEPLIADHQAKIVEAAGL